ncbi:hypothetical protein G9A89_006869 [Geosiphon pyriformis]|nr:hypothetical protein G9A89_006869 [Geosiphon pyriformis]
MGQLKSQQQNQLKELIAEFADIFAKNNNDLGRTDLPTKLLWKATNLLEKKYNGCLTMGLFNHQ